MLRNQRARNAAWFNSTEAAPRPCPAITHKPSDAEAAILAQCTMEGPFGDTETLLTDVKAHIAGPPFGVGTQNRFDGRMKDVDRADVLTLTGYAKNYTFLRMG